MTIPALQDKLTKLRDEYQACTDPHLKLVLEVRGKLLKGVLDRRVAKEANKIGGQFTNNLDYFKQVKDIFVGLPEGAVV